MTRRGKLIILEGIDNIGKTATRDLLVSRMHSEGYPIEGMEFPFKGFDALRSIGKSSRSTDMERFLSHALSHSMTYPLIQEKLEQGKIVILDRYWYSALAYSTTFSSLDYNFIRDLEKVRLHPVQPDLVIYLHSNGVHPNFHLGVEIEGEENDAFDFADKMKKRQLIRAYEHVIETEWENSISIHFLKHNVDDFTSLKDSVLDLEGKIDELFRDDFNELREEFEL